MAHYTYLLPITLALARLASAACQLSNSLTSPPPTLNAALCSPQGAGAWTFAMDTSEVSVPTFSSEAPFGGLASANSFLIFDNACTLRGVYSPDDEGNDCGIPYFIEENFLPYVLTVDRVDFDPAGGYFRFRYANGLYSIGNNHCVCRDISSGLEAESACRCAFAVNGEPA